MRAQFTRPPRVRPAANRTSNDRDGPGTTPGAARRLQSAT